MNAPKLKETARYELVISLDEDFTHEMGLGYYRGAVEMQAEGNNLDELLDTAEIFLCDQDGGDAGEVTIGELSKGMIKLLTNYLQNEMDYADDKRFEHRPANYISAARRSDLASGCASPKGEFERAFVDSLREPGDVE